MAHDKDLIYDDVENAPDDNHAPEPEIDLTDYQVVKQEQFHRHGKKSDKEVL